jgi:AAA domain/CHC2 zinc finger
MTSVNTIGAVQSQHSYKPSAASPKGVKLQEKASYDLQELKRQVGIAPFSQRIQISSDGFSPCPFHSGDSDKSFHIVQKENGAFIGTCFSECGKSFDAIEFVKKHDDVQTGEAIRKLASLVSENGAVPTTVLHKPKPATPMTSEAWAKAGRKVSDADVAKLAASRPHSATPSAATLNAMGFRVAEMHGQVFLAAPYRLGNTFYTIKARNVTTKEFIQENSVSQKGLFNIDAVKTGCDVYIVESELDAAILYEQGLVAVSVINAKQKQIEPEVLKKLTTANRIFLVGDNDEAGQICMDNLSHLLPAEKIYRISFTDGSKDVGELAESVKGNEVVLGTFTEQWDELRKDALSSWVAHHIPFASAIPNEPLEWVIDRLLPLSGLLLITGQYGSMKSLMALEMAKHVEDGTPVFGREVLRKIPVLYVDRENAKQTVGERRTGLGIPDNAVRYWGDWLEGTDTPSLDDPRLAEFAIREKGIIIFDSLQDWLEGANENDASEMTDVMRKFRKLARLGSGVIVLHHDNKSNVGYRGSTAIPANCDMALRVAKTEDGVLQLREEKFRSCAKWKMDLKFNFGERYTCQVLSDRLADKQAKEAAVHEVDTVAAILATHHESNGGAGMNQMQLLKMLQANSVGRRKAEEILAAGVRAKKWDIKGGSRNAILYHLNDWQPEELSL